MPPIITPVNAPRPVGGEAQAQPQQSAKQRAIAAFNASAKAVEQARQQPVQNPTRVAPEEARIVRPQPSTEQVEESAGQEYSSEAPTEQPVETPPEATQRKEEPLSNQYAILARKEKALRAKIQAQEAAQRSKEAELKAREEALEARNSSTKTEYESKYVSKDTLTQDPIRVLSELGLTYDQLTQLAMNGPKPEEIARDQYIKKLEAKLDALETGQKKVLETFEESQQNSYKQALGQMRKQAESLVKSDPSYEMVAAYGNTALNEVVDLIEKTWNEDQILLDVEDAVKEIENEYTNRALKMVSLKKIQQRIARNASPAPKAGQPAQPQNQVKTLTNQMGASKPMSNRDRAILAFKNELKS